MLKCRHVIFWCKKLRFCAGSWRKMRFFQKQTKIAMNWGQIARFVVIINSHAVRSWWQNRQWLLKIKCCVAAPSWLLPAPTLQLAQRCVPRHTLTWSQKPLHALTLTQTKNITFGPQIPNPSAVEISARKEFLTPASAPGLGILDSALCLIQHRMI